MVFFLYVFVSISNSRKGHGRAFLKQKHNFLKPYRNYLGLRFVGKAAESLSYEKSCSPLCFASFSGLKPLDFKTPPNMHLNTITNNSRLFSGFIPKLLVVFLACAIPMFQGYAAAPETHKDRLISEDPPAVVRDFSGGASEDKRMTVDFYVYGSDGLCVPALVCGGNLGMTYQLPGDTRERHCSIQEDGTYTGRTFKYALNPINLTDSTERARGFQPGEDYDPDPNVTAPATRLANRLLLNPEALFKRFMETFKAVEGVQPIPLNVSTGLEVYPRRAQFAFKKRITPDPTDTRYYSRGSSPHVKVLSYENGKVLMPHGSHLALSCIMWRRTEHTDFVAGQAVDLMGNRLPGSSFAAWGWQNGYGGLQYGDYMPGMGMYFVPALALGEAWDFRYNGNIHIGANYQQDPPCWTKAISSNPYIYPGKAYNSEFAPVAFGRVEPRITFDPVKPTQQVRVFDDPTTCYAPQDAFNYEDDKLEVMKWQRKSKGTARIVRDGNFFQGGTAMLFPGKDVPNSIWKPIVAEGLKNMTLTTHWFSDPSKGFNPGGAFLNVEFANAPKLTITASQKGDLVVSRTGEPLVETGLKLQQGWNAVEVAYAQESQSVHLRVGKDFAAAKGKRLTFQAEGGMTALEIGKNGSPSEKGNVLFDAIWINPNDELSDSFEYASLGEMRGADAWKGDWKNLSLAGQVAYSGKQALKLQAVGTPGSITRSLSSSDLRDHTVQLAWFVESKGGEDSFVELRSGDGKSFLRLRGDQEGKLLYQTEQGDWMATNAKFRPDFLENWNELAVIFDHEGNAYLRLNMEWVAQEDGVPLVIPQRDTLSVLSIGRTGTPAGSNGTAVNFDDLRLGRNNTLVADATLYSSTFEYPFDVQACFKQLGWENVAASGACLETGKGAAGGRRYLVLPANAPANAPVSRTFAPVLQDVTAEFSWFHDPEAGKRVDAGYVRLVDAKSHKLTFSADAEGRVRYRVNDQDWKTTEYQLVKGWNKTRVVFSEKNPTEFWMAPQRTGIHPKEQWKLIALDTYTTKILKTDTQQKLTEVFTDLQRIEVGRNEGKEGAFLFDDLFVITNKPSTRDVKQADIGNVRQTFANELDNRLANRDWPQIEKVLVEKNLVSKPNKK